MSRIHGRNGLFYSNILSGGQAEPIAFLSTWSINFSTDKVDVTAMGDNNKIYAAGLPDAQGQLAGFYDNATAQLYNAALDGIPRKMYIYPDRNTPGQYWYGSILPDFSVDGGVGDAVKVSSSWNAASTIAKIG